MPTALGIITVAVLCFSRTAAAQVFPRITLKPANAVLDAEFTFILSIREVADGRLILTDGAEKQLWVGDFRTSRTTPLGRKGKGPLEWGTASWIYPTRADSSIMYDPVNGRWLLFDGVVPVATVPPTHWAVRAASWFRGADQLGNVMSTVPRALSPGLNNVTGRDSMVVQLVDRASGRVERVAAVRDRPRRINATGDAKGQVTGYVVQSTVAFARAEEAHLANDGWLAIVRLDPLRVDWRAPDGTWRKGEPLPLPALEVDAAERRAIIEVRAEQRQRMLRQGAPVAPDPPLPTMLPPLDHLQALSLPDGRILLRRRSLFSVPSSRYVIVNRAGRVDAELRLRPNEEVVGFGARSVYIAFKNDDDVLRLRRHPWP